MAPKEGKTDKWIESNCYGPDPIPWGEHPFTKITNGNREVDLEAFEASHKKGQYVKMEQKVKTKQGEKHRFHFEVG